MGAITIGPGAIDRNSAGSSNNTRIQPSYAATASGTITSFELWFSSSAAGVKVGTAYGSGDSWTIRDAETIGNVSSGSKQTFSGLNIDVQTGDVAAMYSSSGQIEFSSDGTIRSYYKSGDQFSAGTQTYTQSSYEEISVYATGSTPGWANIAKVNGIASSSIAKVNGVAVASIAKVNGVAV